MKLDKVLGALANLQEKYPVILLLVFLTITLFMGYYAVQIQTNASFDTMFSDDSDTLVLQDLLRNEFGSTDTLYILVKIDEDINDESAVKDIRDPQTLKAMHRLSESIRAETAVSSVQSVADALLGQYGRFPETLEESKEMIANSQFDLSRGITSDYTAMSMIVDVNVGQKPGSLEKIEDTINEKINEAQTPAGVTLVLTGLPTLINRIMVLLIGDNIRTVGLAFIGIIIILWLYFRAFRIAIVAVIPVIITLIWLAGAMYLLDIRITMMVASVGAMMVGMGIDYSIHMTHAFHHNVRKAKENVTKSTVISVGGALIASAMTTVAGFLAMLLGETPSSQTQGLVLAIGITFAILSSLLVLPVLLVLQRKLVYSNLDEVLFRVKKGTEQKTKKSALKVLASLGRFQARMPKTVLVIAGIFTLLLIPGLSLVYMDTDDENWIPDDDPVMEALDDVAFNFGGIDFQNFIITIDNEFITDTDKDNPITDLRDPRVQIPLGRLDEALFDLEFLDSVSSPSRDIKQVNNGKIPQDIETIKSLIEENPQIKDNFNDDYSIALLSVAGQSLDRDEYFQSLQQIESITLPEEIQVIPQGGVARDIEIEQELSQDAGKTTLFGFLFVIIIASLFYRSFLAGMLAFIPIIFAIFWTISMMGYANLPFTVVTTGMLAILMGMGIDFSIHIIHKTKENLAEGLDIEDSVVGALTSTGESITLSSMTTIVGFMSLALASLLGTQRLGYTLAIGIFSTYLSCMVIVPAILAIQNNIQQARLEK